MTTKKQEREALSKIEAILAELGEDSYVATAMKGMIADARTNIDNDWACSMYDRWDSAEQKLGRAKDELAEQFARAGMLEKKCKRMHEATLEHGDNDLIRQALIDYRKYLTADNREAAEEIIKLADQPQVKEFTDAVKKHRETGRKDEEVKELIKKLREADNARVEAELIK